VSARRGRGFWAKTLTRDNLFFLGGWYLMIYQAQFAMNFQWQVFVGGMIITGVPGAVQAASLVAGRMPSPPDSPAPPPSPQELPTS
jgi:hypothetical protein